ncbi:MAG: hypothetical protein ACRCSU_01160 [Paracoccaceae bacterium]
MSMTDIAALERRIVLALDRIGRGLDSIPADLSSTGSADAAPQPELPLRPRAQLREANRQAEREAAESARLRESLEAERSANAQLTERVKAIKERQENMVGQLERKVARLTQQLDAHGLEVQRQKRINANLAEINRALREAALNGHTEPHLLNKSMMAELEALRGARATEIAELDEIMQELKPYIGEAANA